jgi:dienelactone hydrolase
MVMPSKPISRALRRCTLAGLLFAAGALSAAELSAEQPLMQAPSTLPRTSLTDLGLLKQQTEQQHPLPLYPLAYFFQPEQFSDPRLTKPLLSPDGQWLLYWRQQGFSYWLCRSRGDGEEQVLLKQRQPPPPWMVFSQDQQGVWLGAADQLQYLDLNRKQLRTLWQPGFALPGSKQLPGKSAVSLLQLSSHGGILQWQRDTDAAVDYQYWLVNTQSTARLLHQQTQPLQQLWLSSEAKPELLLQFSGNRFDTEIQTRPTANQQFQPLLLCPAPARCVPLARHHHTGHWWLLSDLQRDGLSLLQLGADGRPVWLTAPEADATARQPDLSNVLFSASGDLLASARLTDQLHWDGHTAAWQQLLPKVQALAPSGSMQLQLAAQNRVLLVSFSFSDQQQPQHWRLQISPQGQLQQAQQLQLTPRRQEWPGVPAHLLVWPARDGEAIPGYVYLPPGRPLAQSPIVALPHGGPFEQSKPEYNTLVQLLVNQGFIVLQPNYRSSTGFGRRFITLARGDFGQHNPALQDVLSGLDWLIKHGIGDAQQQAMIGHSFGAYLTLQGLSTEPQRFRFGLALAAPVDLAATLQRYVPQAATPAQQRPLGLELNDFGVRWQDPAWQQQLRREAPLTQADQIQRPLYLWAGGLDDRIDAGTLLQYQQLLQQLEKPVRLWLDPNAGHQPHTLLSRQLQLYLTASISLAHLKSAAPLLPAPPAQAMEHHGLSLQQASLEYLDQQLQALEIVLPPNAN